MTFSVLGGGWKIFLASMDNRSSHGDSILYLPILFLQKTQGFFGSEADWFIHLWAQLPPILHAPCPPQGNMIRYRRGTLELWLVERRWDELYSLLSSSPQERTETFALGCKQTSEERRGRSPGCQWTVNRWLQERHICASPPGKCVVLSSRSCLPLAHPLTQIPHKALTMQKLENAHINFSAKESASAIDWQRQADIQKTEYKGRPMDPNAADPSTVCWKRVALGQGVLRKLVACWEPLPQTQQIRRNRMTGNHSQWWERWDGVVSRKVVGLTIVREKGKENWIY